MNPHRQPRLLRPVFRLFSNRRLGLFLERMFWARWLRTSGGDAPDLFRDEQDPDQPLSDYHRQFIDHRPQPRVRILDVGAGPMTILGKTHPEKELDIVATDVLAHHYDRLLERRGITPLVRTVYADTERLTDTFPAESFDFVNASNCIDHCRDPVAAVEQMLEVAKPGCDVALLHRENEAENEHYLGLHQWNFTLRDGHFIIWRDRVETDISARLGERADITCTREGDVIKVRMRKGGG